MIGTYIIAEAGLNHNGERDMAFRLVDEAKKSGADAVKFQTYLTDDLVTRNAVKATSLNASLIFSKRPRPSPLPLLKSPNPIVGSSGFTSNPPIPKILDKLNLE